jgi:hypothetical protein
MMDRSILVAVIAGVGIALAVLCLGWIVVARVFPVPDGDDPLKGHPNSWLRSIDLLGPVPFSPETEPPSFVA